MKSNRIYLIVLVVVLAGLLSGCTGQLAATSWPGVSAQDDVVYLAYTNNIYAVNASTGNMIWKYPEESNRRFFYAAPAVADGLVVTGDYDRTLVALDAQTGAERWTFTSNGRWIASPLVVGDTILAPSADRSLYALDLNGTLRWKFTTRQALWARPISNENVVYQASMDHFLYAIDLASGQEVWKVDMGGALIYSPILSEEHILYMATLANEVLAIDAETGSILWRQQYENTLWTQPSLHEGALYFGDLSGNVYAISADDGRQLATMNLGEGIALTGSPTIIDEGVVFASEEDGLFALDFEFSRRLWTATVNGKLYNGPVVAGDRLVVGLTGSDNLLTAYSPSGSQAWTFASPE